MRSSTRFRQLLARPEPLVMPFAFDAFSAQLVEVAGFDAVGITGSGLAASLLGFPDVGWVTMTEVVSQVRNIVNAVGIPVYTDADTGYGNALNVMRTIREFEAAGVGGLFFEDQEAPKKCGHFEGKRVISREEMILKIKAALEARQDPDLVIVARTDARAIYGVEEAIQRGCAYAEAGADAIFVEAPLSVEELREIAAAIEAPLMVNMVEGGKTPLLSVNELAAMGYKLITFSNSVSRTAGWAMQQVLRELREKGTSETFLERMISFRERNEILGLDRVYELEQRFLPPDDSSQPKPD
jgi:carboxyvinyl-carboxyphosphonate phosphorylmutase